ncbi:phosphodiester glycosidase family protein [Streptomyces marincola]|uniref:Multidrug transporter n=1 Tax=Streptomyces marincola TaxID=2878388 RepID=A0A1W7D2R0_9ACTN|nr:phosphodiester glycosidase family protein [Streptomyces marincola]ARQ71351.1 multidrug transporter [Streptomyces marincola]
MSRLVVRRRLGARSLIAVGAVSALAVGLAPPGATAAPASAAAVAAAAPAAATTGVAEGDGLELSRTEHPIAPGAELTTFRSLESDKWLSAQALTVDLTSDLRVDYLSGDEVAASAPVGELAAAHDPGEGRTTVAAINGDFFDINATQAPLGAGISGGELVQSPSPRGAGAPVTEAVGIGPESAGRILTLYFDGTVTLPDGEAPLAAYNAARLPAGGIGLYTPRWGEADRTPATESAADVTEVVVEDGLVTSVADKPGSGPIPDGAFVLLGRDSGAATLASLAAGDAVTTEYAPRTGDGGPVPHTAVGGRGLLVVDGEPQNWEGRPNNPTAPRTAVGFSRDGQDMYILTVDGRQAHSGGVTLTELAVMMADLGAHNALNLDGGGSTTFLAREPGDTAPEVVGRPSDGHQRSVPNGLAITAPRGSGEVTGFRVTTTADPAASPTGDTVAGGHPDRVFPGLTRQLTAIAHDETYGPADSPAPRWLSARPRVGTVDADGVFHAERSGTAQVTATRHLARGAMELTVLGELRRVEPTTQRVGLAGPEAEGSFGLLGYDAAGNSAPIEPADAELSYDTSLFSIEQDPGTGGFRVSSLSSAASASGVVEVSVAGVTTALAITVGLEDTVVADFEDAEDWAFSHARAAGSLAAEPDGYDGTALRMRYDFGLSTATRAAYATPPANIPVPGQPQSFTLWVEGDGRGSWPSLHLTDAHGTSQVLRAEHVTWEGWRQLTFDVPEGVAYPLSVRRFYLAETRQDAAYADEVVIDDLRAQTPPAVDLPPAAPFDDPLIGTGAEAAARDWQFAVVSDAQFVARNPDSELVAAARRTLREARAADPDFVVINGDWVDEGSPADLEFARDMIEEELGDDLPWYYLPGNHEVMGGSIEAFEAEFGESPHTFDHEGTRFITLDTSSLSLRGGGWDQVVELREQLDDAASDRSVGSVVVMGHVPPRDPTPQPASQLTDRLEADLLEDWLAEFRRETGKGAAYFGAHVGLFDSYHQSGVPYFIGGNAGKNPSAPAAEGGFTGWALVGVDEVSRGEQMWARQHPYEALPDWLTVQTRPHVDALTLQAPTALRVGETADAGAVVTQDEREVPAASRVSTDWTGSRGLHVGAADEAGPRDIAAFDPATGELTGLRAGMVTLQVTVGDTQESTRLRVTG